MDNKSNFKITLKGAHEFNGKTEMINMDYEGQLAVIITLKEADDEHIHSESCIVGGVPADVPVLLLRGIRDLVGEKEYMRASIGLALEMLGRSLAEEDDAAEAEKAAEELVNGEAVDDE